MARPLESAGPFSFLSEGKFPLCHWGILISNYKKVDLEVLWINRKAMNSPKTLQLSWGTLFELFRIPESNINKPHVIEEFGLRNLVNEWSLASIVYVGETFFEDKALEQRGISDKLLQKY